MRPDTYAHPALFCDSDSDSDTNEPRDKGNATMPGQANQSLDEALGGGVDGGEAKEGMENERQTAPAEPDGTLRVREYTCPHVLRAPGFFRAEVDSKCNVTKRRPIAAAPLSGLYTRHWNSAFQPWRAWVPADGAGGTCRRAMTLRA